MTTAISVAMALTADAETPALEMLMRAVGFSPWGAAIVFIAWQTRRDVRACLERMAALWVETLRILEPWADRARDLSTAIRESQVDERSRPRRARTNPVNLPPER